MKIEINKKTCGSSQWNQGREPGDELLIDLNIGNIDEELQNQYVEIAEERLSDDMTDEQVGYELSHGIWETLCNS